MGFSRQEYCSGPTIECMQLCSMLRGNLDRRGVWERMDTCIRMAESLHCPPETITALLIGYNPQYEIKRFEKNYHNTVSWLYSNIE